MIKLDDEEKIEFKIDLTALIDVLFILIIFFILIINPKYNFLNVELPKAEKTNTNLAEKENFIINIGKNEFLIKEKKLYSFDELKIVLNNNIQQNNLQDKNIILSFDKNVAVETFLQLTSFLKQNNLTSFQVLTINQTQE